MIKNYFKIAWRNLWRNKTFTALNLCALTISLAACPIIYFRISYELSYDRSGAHADRVFRVALKLEIEKQPVKEFAVTAPRKFPGDNSGSCEPCKESKNRIKQLLCSEII